MYTDMVGYTALGQRNESLSLALVQEQRNLIRPLLKRHYGREVKTMGDAFLVELPSALDAVRCAYDIQRATRELNFSRPVENKLRLRIGVHLGDVVESEGDISGDAVNVASRVEPLADEGGIAITRQVYDHVENKFELQLVSLGVRLLKNVSTPTEVFKIALPWESEAQVAVPRLDSKRVAVLPLANISPDPSDEYFADGMTEELIDKLSQVRELKVIARTSVMSYKKKEKKASEIGKELGVGTLVEGSVRKAGNRVRVSVQLIEAASEEHMWSSSYDKDLSDIFSIQSEIAENVTKELRVRLLESEKQTLQTRPTGNAEAYTLYLKGRYYWNERTRASVGRGMEYLRKAIQADPAMALAYSDLADAYVIAGDHGMMPTSEALAKIEENALIALKIDPSLSQPHAALGFVHERSFRWAEAEKEVRMALRLNPNNVTARHWYALHLFIQGRYQEAISEWRRAMELDPLSLILSANLGYALVRTGQKVEGFQILKSAIEMNDLFPSGHWSLASAYVVEGMRERALEEARRLLAIGGDEYLAFAAGIFAFAGLRDESVAMLEKLSKEMGRSYADPFFVAAVHAALGDEAKALEWLERAVNEKSAGVVYIKIYPLFDSFRGKHKFKELVGKVGLT